MHLNLWPCQALHFMYSVHTASSLSDIETETRSYSGVNSSVSPLVSSEHVRMYWSLIPWTHAINFHRSSGKNRAKAKEISPEGACHASAGNRTRGWPNQRRSDLEWQRPILPLNHQCLMPSIKTDQSYPLIRDCESHACIDD